MYSTRLKDDRFSVECIMPSGKVRIVQFVVDTGAKFTCCNYKEFDKNMQEEDFAGCEAKTIGGFIEGASVKFYKCSFKQFTIGNIDMHVQDIWITFDKRVKDTVLGMDILKQIPFTADPYRQMIYFYKDYDEYRGSFELFPA